MDNLLLDLGLSYLEAGYRDETFTFSRLPCSMIARVGPDLYTTMGTVAMDRDYAVSLDFDSAGFKLLLSVIAPVAASELRRLLGGTFQEPTEVELPWGSVVARVREQLGEPLTNGEDTYVPFVAFEFWPPDTVSSVSID